MVIGLVAKGTDCRILTKDTEKTIKDLIFNETDNLYQWKLSPNQNFYYIK